MTQVEHQGKMTRVHWPPNGHLSQWVIDQFEPGYQGYAVDVGASDGISINSTHALEKAHHWTVLSVEANPDFGPELKKERAWVEMCACDAQPGEAEFSIHEQNPESFSSLRPANRPDLYPNGDMTWKRVTVPVRTVDQLLDKWQFPRLDLLAIDVEGTELDVLKGCDLRRWKTRVVIVEQWDKQGPEDIYLADFGYRKIARNVHNSLFLLEAK